MDKDKNKVLVINTVSTDKNGITNVIFNLFRAIDKSDLQIDLLTINTPSREYVDEIEASGGKVIVLTRSIKHPLRYKKTLIKIIKQNKYAVVHAHGNSHTLALEMSAAKKAGCKVRIAHAHSTSCTHMLIHKLFARSFYKNTTCGLACSEAAGKFLFGKQPFNVIHNGIDTARFSFDEEMRNEIRARLGLKNCKIIGNVGMFAPVKNQMFLLGILKKILQRDDSYRLMLVGDGERREDIRLKAESLGIAYAVNMVGAVNDTEKYLAAFDVFAMPSLFEGLPLSLLEAQANGLQCVVSDNITRESDKTGNVVFIPLDNEDAWINELENAANCSERFLHSEDAVKAIENCGYSAETSGKQLKRYYINE